MSLELHICDVFSDQPLAGNSLSVVLHDDPLDADTMQRLTRELRQFETVFVRRSADGYKLRVFDLVRELDFAGHPLLGAAAVLHRLDAPRSRRREVQLELRTRRVAVTTVRLGGTYLAEMDQGRPLIIVDCDGQQTHRALSAFSLSPTSLHEQLRCSVMSAGLRYLVVPIDGGIDAAAVVHPLLAELVEEVGAEFAYLLDVQRREGRHWENDGSLEDIATGSAAGVAGAYLVRHGYASAGKTLVIRQGRFVGRPSALEVTVDGPAAAPSRVRVSGPVSFVARGVVEAAL